MQRVTRRQVLAFRSARQGLDRANEDAGDLPALDLGIQDTPPGSAAQALSVRTGVPTAGPKDDARLVTTWTFRGAPHVQRADDLAALSRALWPVSDDDALARLDTSSSPVRASGLGARDALRLIAATLADIVTEPMPKGEASSALTPRIPAEMTVDCKACDATHVVETLFRTAVLPAGLAFDPDARQVTFVPIPDWPGIPDAADGVEGLLHAYLRLHGPATLADAAAFLGARPGDLADHLPDGLVEVEVEGDPATTGDGEGDIRLLAAGDVDLLTDPPAPPPLRLLPPSDPSLQARDRAWFVPDEERRKAVWPILGRPGAVVVDGEVAGVWRGRKKGRRLDVTIEPFDPLPKAARRHLDAEADLIAAARGASGAQVEIT